MNKRKYLLYILILLGSVPVSSLDIESVSIDGGPLFMLNTDKEGAPSPLLPNIGFSADIRGEGEMSYFIPSVSFCWNYYQLSESDTSIVQPAEIEYADSLLLLNILMDFPYSIRYLIKDKITAGWLVSPAVMLRIPVKAWGEGENQKSDILGYFYSGRFIFIETGGYLLWDYSDKNSFKSVLSLYFPLYHLWDGQSFFDEFMIKLGFGFSFKSK